MLSPSVTALLDEDLGADAVTRLRQTADDHDQLARLIWLTARDASTAEGELRRRLETTAREIATLLACLDQTHVPLPRRCLGDAARLDGLADRYHDHLTHLARLTRAHRRTATAPDA